MNALFRRGGKHLQYSVANIFRTISTKFYQNRPGFVDDVTKTFGVFWGSQKLLSSNCSSLTKRER